MAGSSPSETKRIRYLLGLSSPAEREHIESEFFEDEDAFQEMLTAEDDLIDAFARNELTREERRRFEKNFVSSLGGRNRVQFARAFAGTISATRSVQTKPASTLLDVFKIFQLPSLLRTATIALVVVFVAVLGCLIIDRRRISEELRELRAESAELSKRTDALQRSSDTERTRDMSAQPADLRAQTDKSRYRERPTAAPRRARQLPAVKRREKFEMLKVGPGEQFMNTSDATLGNTLVHQKITQLPLNARNVANLLSLQPAVTPSGYIAGDRSDQANTTLDGLKAGEPLSTYFLMPRNTNSSDETAIVIAGNLRWVRFQISLETAAIHFDYRLTIRAADGRPVTSVIWIEPLTPNQTVIDTPAVFTSDLPSGDYVLLLEGTEPDGSFIKVAEFSFKVIKY